MRNVMLNFREAEVNKEKLVQTIQNLLKTDEDLSFLLSLDEDNLKTLLACLRDRLG